MTEREEGDGREGFGRVRRRVTTAMPFVVLLPLAACLQG